MNSKETKQSSEKELRVPSSLATRETRIKVKWQIKEEIEEEEGKAGQSRPRREISYNYGQLSQRVISSRKDNYDWTC